MLCIICLAPVSATNTLHPAIAGEQLGVPAIAGVVRDLVPHVLPELESGRVHADLLGEGENESSVLLLRIKTQELHLEQEHLDPGHKVTQGLIGHKSS